MKGEKEIMTMDVTDPREICPCGGSRMREELETILRSRHKRIFARLNFEKYPTATSGKRYAEPWLSCGSGWFPILDHLCTALQERTDRDGAPQIVLEKLGTADGQLQFDTTGSKDLVHAELIQFAQDLAAQTCECCGAPGHQVQIAWDPTLHTRCPVHSGERYLTYGLLDADIQALLGNGVGNAEWIAAMEKSK